MQKESTTEQSEPGGCALTITMPIHVTFDPQPDITAYELAQVLGYQGRLLYKSDWDAMSEGVKRHFTKME